MFTKIIIKDFFSFKGFNEVELNAGTNILLGINGSGKTSFLNAIRLLYEGVCGDGFENLFQIEWGGFNEVVNANGKDIPNSIELTYVFDSNALKKLDAKSPFNSDVYYRITIKPLGSTGYTIEEKLFSENHKRDEDAFVYLDFKNAKGVLSVYHSTGIKTEMFKGDTSAQELILRQISDPRRYLPMHIIKKAITEMALYETFDTSNNSTIRKPAKSSSELRLSSDGENMASVLNNLLTQDTFTYDAIEEKLQTVNPNFLKLTFQFFGASLYLSMSEKNMRHTIGIRFISDGTLRYILMMCVLMNKHNGRLLGLDEPEGRLHPDMIKSMADMIKRASKQSQTIIATHSPLLANLFDLDDVLVFEKNDQNATVVRRLYEEDFPEWAGEYLPGQMWLHGVIGGKRW